MYEMGYAMGIATCADHPTEGTVDVAIWAVVILGSVLLFFWTVNRP